MYVIFKGQEFTITCQSLLQSYTDYNNDVLSQRYTNKTVAENREPGNKACPE